MGNKSSTPVSWSMKTNKVGNHQHHHPLITKSAHIDKKNQKSKRAACLNKPLLLQIQLRNWQAVSDILQTKSGRKQTKFNRGAPLRNAIERGAPIEVILDILQADKKAAGMADQYGKLALHYECFVRQEGDLVAEHDHEAEQEDQEDQEELVGQEGEFTSQGLHPSYASSISTTATTSTLYSTKSPEIIQALLLAHPQGASTPTHNGDLPLHVACRAFPSVEILQVLLKAYPKAVERRNEKGELPLHVAIKRGVSLGSLRVLLEAFPGAAASPCPCPAPPQTQSQTQPESENEQSSPSSNSTTPAQILPLHLASQRRYPVPILRALLQAHPTALSQPYPPLGDLPLHLACYENPHNSGSAKTFSTSCAYSQVRYLLQADVEQGKTIQVKNKEGRLPLHLAVMEACATHHPFTTSSAASSRCYANDAMAHAAHNSMLQTIHLLLQTYPEGVLVQDEDGRTALHYACMASRVDRLDSTPLHLYSHLHQHEDASKPCQTLAEETVSILLQSPHAAQAALVCDTHGDTPLHYSTRRYAHYSQLASSSSSLMGMYTRKVMAIAMQASKITLKLLAVNPLAAGCRSQSGSGSSGSGTGRLALHIVAERRRRRRVRRREEAVVHHPPLRVEEVVRRE